LCADARVFDAMWNAGTYCPYNASIGEDAKLGWTENIDDIPKGSKIFQNISEQQELELSKETEGNNGDWKVFWTLATFMLLPIL